MKRGSLSEIISRGMPLPAQFSMKDPKHEYVRPVLNTAGTCSIFRICENCNCRVHLLGTS
eukprot:SAG11_NODE_37226_length_258_cov_0.572327_1_plen_59_part_10